jgi:hypothetical protein
MSASLFTSLLMLEVCSPRAKATYVARTSRYTLIQIFSKFGSLARLDFLFHKSGPLRGKPRGYAFVEYAGEAVSATFMHHLYYPLRKGKERERKDGNRKNGTNGVGAQPGILPRLSPLSTSPGGTR